MDEELFDPSAARAPSGRGPFVPGPGRMPAPPVGEPGGPLAVSDASALGPAPNDWPVWSGFAVLVAALVVAAFGGLIVDIPAIALGVKISSKSTPPGIEFADTVVQDIAFVLTAVLFARLGGRTARSWQFGYRSTPAWRAARLTVLTIGVFLVFSVLWEAALNVTEKDTKLLEALGTNETTLLLVLSALLTTVIAPICEETLFRGYIFGALSKWRGWLPAAVMTGILFGGVHYGSAPVEDLVPLGVLGFALCLLYRRTGSLYPCIALHSLNNSFAFGELEGWGWWIPLLMVGALVAI
ncbi:MAG TPA: type II CAAX endopeptidase family protein, partial [Solirubrobacteraceae bacterium]|nr:type II CAAX endopeptidase family protein [Solirubrobacteraceae bacterium]